MYYTDIYLKSQHMYVIIMEIYRFKVHVHCMFLPFFMMACTLYTSQYSKGTCKHYLAIQERSVIDL